MEASRKPLLEDEQYILIDSSADAAERKPTFTQRAQPFLGLIMLFVSAFFFSIGILCVKLLTKRGVSTYHIALCRMTGQMLLAAIVIFIQGDSLFVKRDVLPYLLLRGLCGSTALTLFYTSVEALDLGDANAIYFTGPFFGTLVAYMWLGERITMWSLGMAILSFTGFIFVARPEFLFPTTGGDAIHQEHIFMWSCVALLGAVLSGFALACIRAINRRATVMQMVFYFGLVGSCFLVPLTIYKHSQHTVNLDWINSYQSIALMMVVVVASCIAQALLNGGMSREKVGVGAFLRNLDIVFAYVYQVTILGRSAHMCSLLGSSLIVMSSLLVFVSRFFDSRKGEKIETATSSVQAFNPALTKSFDYNSCTGGTPRGNKL